MNDDNIAQHFFNRLDEKDVKAYWDEMTKWDNYKSSRFWSLNDSDMLNNRFRIFAWIMLWKKSAKAKKNRVAPTEQEIAKMKCKLYSFQQKAEHARKAQKEAEQAEREAYWNFQDAVGIKDYHEPSVYISRYMSH